MIYCSKKNFKYVLQKWGLGIGDWGLGIGDWGLGPMPNPQSPIPNPQSPNKFFYFKINKNKLKRIKNIFKIELYI